MQLQVRNPRRKLPKSHNDEPHEEVLVLSDPFLFPHPYALTRQVLVQSSNHSVVSNPPGLTSSPCSMSSTVVKSIDFHKDHHMNQGGVFLLEKEMKHYWKEQRLN